MKLPKLTLCRSALQILSFLIFSMQFIIYYSRNLCKNTTKLRMYCNTLHIYMQFSKFFLETRQCSAFYIVFIKKPIISISFKSIICTITLRNNISNNKNNVIICNIDQLSFYSFCLTVFHGRIRLP